jgi:hypothetical protein
MYCGLVTPRSSHRHQERQSSASDATEGVKNDPTQKDRRAERRLRVDPIEIDPDVPPGWVVQEAHRRHQQTLDIRVLADVARRRLGAIDVADPVIDRLKADRR